VSNLEFYKNGASKTKLIFANSLAQYKMNARIKLKISRTRALKIVFHFLKSRWRRTQYYQSFLCFVLDPWWNPFAEKQGIGRAHRIGQLNKVNVVRFITKKHVEEKLFGYKKTKTFSDALLDENHISPEIEENLDFIA
jgi:non-specific serine/threonine protein kinase